MEQFLFSARRGGQLKENTVEALVAAIAIVLLIGGVGYFTYSYFKLSAQQNEEEAKGLLNVLDAKVKATGEGQESSFLVKGPCEGDRPSAECFWYLTGWGKQEDDRPQRCFFKSCLCVCNVQKSAVELKDHDSSLRDACQNGKTGFCTSVDAERVTISSAHGQVIEVESLEGTHRAQPPELGSKSFIPFKSNLIGLKVQRSKGQLEIALG